GLPVADLVSVEGPAFILDDLDARMADPVDRSVALEVARAIERVPELIGFGPHLIATGIRSLPRDRSAWWLLEIPAGSPPASPPRSAPPPPRAHRIRDQAPRSCGRPNPHRTPFPRRWPATFRTPRRLPHAAPGTRPGRWPGPHRRGPRRARPAGHRAGRSDHG